MFAEAMRNFGSQLRRLRCSVYVTWLMGGSAILALSGCQSINHYPETTELHGVMADLPTIVSQYSPYLYIVGSVNGAGPFNFLVDTGTDGLVLYTDTAAAASIVQRSRLARGIDATGAALQFDVGRVERFESGRLALRNFDVMVAPRHKSTNPKEAGIIGLGVFREVFLQMDFPAGRVAVHSTAPSSELHLPYKGSVPVVQLTLGTKTVAALLDTGYNGVLRIPERLSPARSLVIGQAAMPVSGIAQVFRVGQLPGDVHLGPLTLRDPPVSLYDGEVLLGAGAVHSWSLTFDQRAKRIYVQAKRGTLKTWAAQEWQLPIGAAVVVADRTLRVVHRETNGVADLSGLAVEDIITHINGDTVEAYVQAGTFPPLRTLRVERGAQALQIDVRETNATRVDAAGSEVK